MSLVADASRKSYEKSYEIRNGCWSHEVRTATANVQAHVVSDLFAIEIIIENIISTYNR